MKKKVIISILAITLTIAIIIILNASKIYSELTGEKEAINEDENGKIKEKYHLVKSNGEWKKNGIFTSYYPNGQVNIQGLYEADKREDEWKVYYVSGKIGIIKRFKLDKEVGEAIEYYENGQTKSHYYYNDKNLLDGKALTYYVNGKLDVIIEFSNGKSHGDFIKYNPKG